VFAIPAAYLLCSIAALWRAICAAWCFYSCELHCRSVECVSLHCFNAQPYIFAVVNCSDISLTLSAFSLLACFNALPDIFAVMNCCVLALSDVLCSGLLTWTDNCVHYSDTLYYTTTSKESACRMQCRFCQQTLPKRWFANANMRSYCDVTNTVYQETMTAIRHCSRAY